MDSFDKIYNEVMECQRQAITHHEVGYGGFVNGKRVKINVFNKYNIDSNGKNYTEVHVFDMHSPFKFPNGRDITKFIDVDKRHAMLLRIEKDRGANLTDWINLLFEVNDE